MSLINDVLRDIDRRSPQSSRHASPILNDTIAVPLVHARRRLPGWRMIVTAAAVLGALAVYLRYGPEGVARLLPEPTAPATPHASAVVDPVPPAAEPPAANDVMQSVHIDAIASPPPEPPSHAPDQHQAAAEPRDTTAAPEQGRMHRAELAASPPPPATTHAVPVPTTAVAIQPGKQVKLRTAPQLDSEVLHVLSARSPLSLLGQAQGYLQVRTMDGTTGWISAKYARVGDAAPESPAVAVEPPPPSALQEHAAARPSAESPATRNTAVASAATLHIEALRALDRGHPAAAERALLKALQLDPRHAPSISSLAALLLQQARRTELEARLAELARHTPPEATAAALLARLQAERGAVDDALQTLERLPEESLDGEQLAILATLRQRKGRHDKAIETYRHALAVGPRKGTTWAGLAVSLDFLGNAADARTAWEAALAAGPLDAALDRHARNRLAALRSNGD